MGRLAGHHFGHTYRYKFKRKFLKSISRDDVVRLIGRAVVAVVGGSAGHELPASCDRRNGPDSVHDTQGNSIPNIGLHAFAILLESTFAVEANVIQLPSTYNEDIRVS